MVLFESTALEPWGPIAGLLFELDSDDVQHITELAGLSPDWTLTEKQAFSHKTRKRVYRERIGKLYSKLPDDQKQQFILNIARELIKQNQSYRERLNELLQNIGWALIEDRLIQINVLNPFDLINLPKIAHEDLSKAAERLSDDLSGAITAACGAVDSVCNRIYEKYPDLGDIGQASFQEKVNKALSAVKALENLYAELIQLGWEDSKAGMFCKNLKGALSQAAYVMQTLRSEMGDVHGSKLPLATLVFDSIKWAMIISSLLREDE